MKSVTGLQALVFISRALFAAECPDFLAGLNEKGRITIIADKGRSVILVGETHASPVEGETTSEAAEFAKAITKIRDRLVSHPIVFLSEGTARVTEDEDLAFAKMEINKNSIQGVFLGLENPYAKSSSILGSAYWASQSAGSAFAPTRVGHLTELEVNKHVTNFLSGTNLGLRAMARTPLYKYWGDLRQNPGAARDPYFQKLDKFVQAERARGAKDPEEGHVSKFVGEFLDGAASPSEAILQCGAYYKQIATAMANDPQIPETLRKQLPREIFERPVSIQTFRNHLAQTSRLREHYMVENILLGMSQHPEKDVFVQMGEAHRIPVENSLRDRLKSE